jgi:hypothetical protein
MRVDLWAKKMSRWKLLIDLSPGGGQHLIFLIWKMINKEELFSLQDEAW